MRSSLKLLCALAVLTLAAGHPGLAKSDKPVPHLPSIDRWRKSGHIEVVRQQPAKPKAAETAEASK